MDNRYLYTWIMGCAFCRLAGKEQMPMMITLLQHSFYTLRKAAFDRIAVIGGEEDLAYFYNVNLYEPKRHEFKSAFFMLDCKAYFMSKFDQLWADNGLDTYYNLNMIEIFLPKNKGRLVDPETIKEPFTYNFLSQSDKINYDLDF